MGTTKPQAYTVFSSNSLNKLDVEKQIFHTFNHHENPFFARSAA
jgi:hypothetical protein